MLQILSMQIWNCFTIATDDEQPREKKCTSFKQGGLRMQYKWEKVIFSYSCSSHVAMIKQLQWCTVKDCGIGIGLLMYWDRMEKPCFADIWEIRAMH